MEPINKNWFQSDSEQKLQNLILNKNIFYNKILNSIFRASYIFDIIPHIRFTSSAHFQIQLCSTSMILYRYRAMFITIKQLQALHQWFQQM